MERYEARYKGTLNRAVDQLLRAADSEAEARAVYGLALTARGNGTSNATWEAVDELSKVLGTKIAMRKAAVRSLVELKTEDAEFRLRRSQGEPLHNAGLEALRAPGRDESPKTVGNPRQRRKKPPAPVTDPRVTVASYIEQKRLERQQMLEALRLGTE